MTSTQYPSMKHFGQWSLTGLLSASIVGASLILAVPAFAETDAGRMKDMEDKLNALQNEVSQMTNGMDHHSVSAEGLPLHGFMDVGFALNSQGDRVINPQGSNIGSLDFYLTPHFGNVKALVEPNFEATKEGIISTDIERLQIGYTFSDAATVWGGRFHTPYGYWNTAFHHGEQMQTSVFRPLFLDFEDKGGILPAHMVGFWCSGKFKTGSGRLTYDAFVGNGPKITIAGADTPPKTLGVLDPNISGDNDHSAMVGLNVGYEFLGNMNGLRLALHMVSGDVDSYPAAPPAIITASETGVRMAGGSAIYITNEWEVLSEYYGFDDKDKSGNTGTHKSWASYLQVGKNINDLTPYFRLERTVLNQQDNYFSMQASGQSYLRQALGLRYNLNSNAALKFELLNSNFMADVGRTALGYRSLAAQYAIGF
jgi:hypothetical protein